MHQHPMFDERLVKRFEFGIDLIKYVDGQPNKTYDKLIIHPIEVGNKLEFRGEKGSVAFFIPVRDITEVNTTDQTKGKFDKKNLLIEIEFKDSHGVRQVVAFNVEDNYIEGILTKTLKPMEQEYWDTIDLQYDLDGTQKTTNLYYRCPFLSDGEELLWMNVKTEGINNKHLRWLEALTNFRAIYYDFGKHECGRIPLNFVDDVIAMNKQSTSTSSRFGGFTAVSNKTFMGTGLSMGSGESRTLGDVLFMKEGKSIVTFSKVSDPDLLANLAKTVIKKLFAPVSARRNTQLPMADATTTVTDYTCAYCGNINRKGSIYCSRCGFALS